MSLSNELQPINHCITLNEAVSLTTRFRNQLPVVVRSEYSSHEVFALSETFKKSAFVELLAQTDAVAIRAYMGMTEENKVCLIFVAVNDNNLDILPANSFEAGNILEYGQRCPPICANSPLTGQQ
jgi:hypothetical protein